MADEATTDEATDPVVPESEPIDVSVYEAKISELTAIIAERDATIGELNAEITAVKAANYDMLMAAPGTELPPVEEEVAADTVTSFDDLFDNGKD